MLNDAEWRVYAQWMRNCFRRGTISERRKQIEEDRWFDPAFQNFINTEILEEKLRRRNQLSSYYKPARIITNDKRYLFISTNIIMSETST